MKFIFLTDQFYSDYSHCPEIEQKKERPYTQVCLEYNGIQFAIPFRSNIKHNHVYWTDKKNNCGLDFSKAVIIENSKYIDTTGKPHIRPKEFKALLGKEHMVVRGLLKYIKEYLKAKQMPNKTENIHLLKYSTLQYFEKHISSALTS